MVWRISFLQASSSPIPLSNQYFIDMMMLMKVHATIYFLSLELIRLVASTRASIDIWMKEEEEEEGCLRRRRELNCSPHILDPFEKRGEKDFLRVYTHQRKSISNWIVIILSCMRRYFFVHAPFVPSARTIWLEPFETIVSGWQVKSNQNTHGGMTDIECLSQTGRRNEIGTRRERESNHHERQTSLNTAIWLLAHKRISVTGHNDRTLLA